MRKIFNLFSALFKSPTQLLAEELNKDVWQWLRDSSGPVVSEEFLPSIKKIKSLLEKGADVNAVPANGITVLDSCASSYEGYMVAAQVAAEYMEKSVTGRVTPEEWKGYADHIFEVAKVLIEAGADPRRGRIYWDEKYDKYMVHPQKSGLTFGMTNSALVKDFKSLLETAIIAAEKRDANKPKPPQNKL